MEFRLTSNLDVVRNQQITANFEEVSAWLDTELEPYLSLTVTEDSIPTAKQYRANLRKVKDRIEDYRREAKKAVLVPYTAFEEKSRVLTGKIDAAVANIDTQVKSFEESEKQRKIAALHNEYDVLIDDDTAPYCEWETIFDAKWANKTVSFDSAVTEIKAAIDGTKNDMEAIRGMGGDDTAYLLDIYRQTHNISTVIRKASELKTMREREEQRKREAEERRKEIERIKAESESTPEKAEPQTATEVPKPDDEDEIVNVVFRVICKKSDLFGLSQYMRHHAIKYTRA